MVKPLLNVGNSLIQLDRLVESLEAIILRGEDEVIGSEMFENMYPEGKRRLQVILFEGTEFRLRGAKNRIMMPVQTRL